MRLFTMAALAAATLPLAACLGGGGDNDVDLPENFEELTDLYDAAEAGELEEASEEMMSGTATLAGAIAFEDLGEEGGEVFEAIGELALTADFDENTITGTADNFALYVSDTDELEGTLSGELTVDGDITGTTMEASLQGDLVEGGDSNVVDMTMEGTFYDANGDLAVTGEVYGYIDDEEADGGFAAIEE
ncbi:hypothetical protein [Celeribacter halophilus]|uniref:hypothetical protein n=1 Tax=Celeribacter halophilus TaxID=576117 RepID=UPI001C088AA4|nr:hypothetical protein [Celeribacter halophilus]MBU2888875.1 hypothetical protein [Celeribacter halophilus]MDO6511993.1 hypothetical protein [Celeribacter halophilus]